MPITKAVVPVAGLGTRLLPTTRALPKEMLPLGRYPVVQHVVEELATAGLRECLLITSRSKPIIKDQLGGSAGGIALSYVLQPIPQGMSRPAGTGAAIACAEDFAGGEPFVVANGDTIIRSATRPNYVGRMMASHPEQTVSCTLGVDPVDPHRISQYGVVKPEAEADPSSESFAIDDVVEKPSPEASPSDLAINGRYIFEPEIFDEIRKLRHGPHSEIEVTDAIRALIQSRRGVRAVRMKPDEIRYDIGNHENYYKAFIDFALRDVDYGRAVRSHLTAHSEQG
jgi:UTP--glucose-1-phosphate uridylyltransferase